MVYMTKYEIFRDDSNQQNSRLDFWSSFVHQRCSESFAECVALEDCMGALWVHEALMLEHLVDLVSSNGHIMVMLIT